MISCARTGPMWMIPYNSIKPARLMSMHDAAAMALALDWESESARALA
jgi:hypothetical protein